MIRLLSISLCFAIIFTLTGCVNNGSSGRTDKQPTGINEEIPEPVPVPEPDPVPEPVSVPEPDPVPEPVSEPINEPAASSDSKDRIDVDLTELSSTMAYSEVYNMMVTPENYVGKKVKMDGTFTFYHDETSDKNYYACIIADATACCSQGIEFVLTDDYVYPDDYPEEGEDICVTGVFDTYKEGDYTYCTLRDAKIIN